VPASVSTFVPDAGSTEIELTAPVSATSVSASTYAVVASVSAFETQASTSYR